jgi:hypothetical protein
MRTLVLILAIAAAAPALAEPATTEAPARPAADPNARICRTTTVVGSRVGRTRRCATRQQWVEYDVEQRRQTRETLRQGTQPACMTPGERAAIAGRYAPFGVGCGQ